MNKIVFHSNRNYNNPKNPFNPVPSAKAIPEWFSSADMYIKDPTTGEELTNPWNGGKTFSFKACPALIDTYTSGYILKTPCDIKFTKHNGVTYVETPRGFEDFCASRGTMPQLQIPYGYSESHFHWFPNWAPSLPSGYSALYINPINHFELPFITTAGIIENDKVDTPGLVPFFLKQDFEGIIPAGTPYLQIIPFKREDWEMEFNFHTDQEIFDRYKASGDKFRNPEEGGVYKKGLWDRIRYR
jgi:hypothetical protein